MDSYPTSTPALLPSTLSRTWCDALVAGVQPAAVSFAAPITGRDASAGAHDAKRFARPAAQVALVGARPTDLLGHVPRGAPV